MGKSILALYSNHSNILYVGCVKGELWAAIKEINPLARIFGVDISEESLKLAQEKLDLIVLGDVLDI